MSQARQQVVFIGRILWGGGAERVTYDLLHALSPETYDLAMVPFFRQKGVPVQYGPHVQVHCLDFPQDQGLPFGDPKLQSTPARSSPVSLVRRSLNKLDRVGQRLNSALHRSIMASIDPNFARRLEAHPVGHGVTSVLGALWPKVVALDEVLRQFDSHAVLVPVMEEAAALVWLSQMIRARPYICSLHTVESVQMPLMYPGSIQLPVHNWLFRGALLGAHRTVVPAEGCRTDLVAHFEIPEDHIDVIGNPVHLGDVARLAGQPPAQPIPKDGRCVMVHVARLAPEKNHRLLIDACAHLRRRWENFVVLCIGGGSQHDAVQTMINQAGLQNHIQLVGEQANPFAYMAAARALLLTSNYESFAMVLAEAMVCGAVPVAVDCKVGPRSVLDGGRCGLLTPPGDAQALADAMYKICTNDSLHAQLQQAGRERVVLYDVASIARRWSELIHDARTTGERGAQLRQAPWP